MEFKENRYDGEEQVVAALADRQKYTTDVASETFRKKVEARLFTQRSMLWTEIRRRATTAPGWQWHRPDALDRIKADPAGARLILAVAGKDGIVSEVHRREIADKPVERPIDRTRPATWARPGGFRFETTRTAYGFIARLKKHDGVAGGLRSRGNQGGVQARRRGAMSAPAFAPPSWERGRPARMRAEGPPHGNLTTYKVQLANPGRRKPGRRPPRKPVIPAKAGVHGFRRRFPSGPAVAAPVNR